MNKTKAVLTLSCMFLLSLVLASCGNEESVQIKERVISVKTAIVELSSQRVTRSFTASLEGEKQADIYARIAEAVEHVKVCEGQNVSEGQTLIVLDKSGPTSMYRRTESLFRNAEKNYRKMEYLFGEGAISEAQFDAAKTEYEVSKASFESAAGLVEIKSPIAGVVTSMNVTDGDFLNMGQKLVTIASIGHLRARFGVNSRDVSNIKEGAKVETSADEVSHKIDGEVISVARSADPMTRAFQVEVLLNNPELLYHPGMFVRVTTVVDELTDVIIVPRGVVLTLDDKQVVFIISNSIAHKLDVSLGVELEGKVVVTDGLHVGDTLVTLGQNYLDDGFKVEITGMETSSQ
ncbi:MAG: efflux RND transporter periplasmic adaptor subunit [candidate division Zixibacteria bacterium]|nr:efflux RND transporter periplasmic adaptor subunit [candidate division Zixibacteria bacterium]